MPPGKHNAFHSALSRSHFHADEVFFHSSFLYYLRALFGSNDGWMKNPKSAMLSCNDGFRPVSFYLESMDAESISRGCLTFLVRQPCNLLAGRNQVAQSFDQDIFLDIKSVTIVRMEVPCCGGIENAANGHMVGTYKHIVIPAVFILLGVYIIMDSGLLG